MTPTKRIVSIDIMRGLTLFLMLFVNDLYVPGVPKWLGHATESVDGMGTAEDPTFVQKSWWGILGLIGWGYVTAAITYLCLKDKLTATVVVLLVFLGLNSAYQSALTDFLDPLRPLFGVILGGNIPLIVLSGLIVGILVKKFQNDSTKILTYILGMAVICFVLAFVLHRWFIISKLSGTPSWAMLCNGISLLLFALLFYLIDVKNKVGILSVFKPAGQNSLGAYLAPDIVYYLLWALPFQALIYKQDDSQLLAVFGSVVWAFAMIAFAALLAKLNIRLKL